MTPTVLVTGASGFIGRRVVAQLATEGRFEIVTASRRPDPRMPAGVTHHAVDMLALGAPVDLIQRVRPTHLVHLAWNAEPGRFWNAPDNLDWAAATLTLVRAFLEAGGTRAVLAGTCAEYDWTGASSRRQRGGRRGHASGAGHIWHSPRTQPESIDPYEHLG